MRINPQSYANDAQSMAETPPSYTSPKYATTSDNRPTMKKFEVAHRGVLTA